MIYLWIEGIEDARRFYEVAKGISEKTILAYVVGASRAAHRASGFSYRLSIVCGSADTYKVALKQASWHSTINIIRPTKSRRNVTSNERSANSEFKELKKV